MAFEHLSTFLRSALVRDPFCLGGLIGPEDVLRLEEQYPALFDKPPHSPPASSPRENEKEKVGNITQSHPKKTTPSKAVASKPKTTAPPVIPKKAIRPTGSASIPAIAASHTRKPIVSQFHRNCLESNSKAIKHVRLRASPVKLVNRSEIGGAGRRRTMARPAQSFSLEDLRETLKQVLLEDAHSFPIKKAQQSPYTEDLVKKFLGRKLQEMKKSKKRKNINEPVKFEEGMKTNKSSLTFVPLKEARKQRSSESLRSQKGKVKQTHSAPGFIRGIPDLPPVPAFTRPSRKSSRSRSSGKETSPSKSKHKENHVGDSTKHVSWAKKASDRDEQSSEISFEGISTRSCDKEARALASPASSRKETEQDESRDTSPKPTSGRLGSQIYLRSQKQVHPEVSCVSSSRFVRDNRFPTAQSSHFRQLASHSESAKWEAKRQLRKEETQSSFLKNEKQRPSKTSHENIHGCRRHNKKPFFVDTESVKLKTQRVLQKIAEELVCTEILHQLREIKQEQEVKNAKTDKSETKEGPDAVPVDTKMAMAVPTSLDEESPKSLPKFVPTTDYESESDRGNGKRSSKSKSTRSSSIILKTPELTPPSASSRSLSQGKRIQNEAKEKKEISLHTPELSPSPRKVAIQKIIEMKAKLQQNNVETDCSEMSDFVLSESANEKLEKSKSKSVKESIKLDTPRLSRSYPLEKPQRPIEDDPENNASTLSGVSTFQESDIKSHKSEDEDIKDEENSKKDDVGEPPKSPQNISNYSDDFVPENISSVVSASSHHSKTLSEDVIKQYKGDFEEDLNDHLNISGETVIDLLSEGEFVGNAYKSPGELSLRFRDKPVKDESSSVKINGSNSSHNKSVEDDTEISHISSGAQVSDGRGDHQGNISMGEYLMS